MEAVILAAGDGERAYPLCDDKPKSLYKIMGKPILGYVVDRLIQAGLTDLIFVVPEGDDRINRYLDGLDGLNIQYAHQREALGMGNALENVRDLVEEDFLVVNGDDIYESELLRKILAEHVKNSAGLTMAVKKTDTPWKYGIVDLEQGIPKRIVEKPPKGEEPSNLAVIGAYLLNSDIFDFLGKTPLSDHQFEDACQRYMDRGDAKVVEHDGYFGSFKYPWDLLDLNKYLMNAEISEQEIHPSVEFKDRNKTVIEGNIKIEAGVKIYEYAVIRGPSYIGKNSIIGNHTLVRNSSLGEDCLVGYSTEIVRSIIGNDTEFHLTYIGDSVIEERSWFGGGTIAANKKLHKSPVKVEGGGQRISAEHHKLGIIAGHDVRAGTGIQFRPGTLIGSDTWIEQGLTIQSNIPPHKFVRNKDGKPIIEDRL